ncbi:MAG: hypothetical protein R2838_17750 [Caldilineaceae bacterium]
MMPPMRAVLDADRPNNWGELIAFGVGMAFGVFAEPARIWQSEYWFLYPYALLPCLCSVCSPGSSPGRSSVRSEQRLRRPLTVDIFDLTPFEPIGRQSLMLSFSFVVGTTISLLFAASFGDFLTVPNLIVYSVLVTVTVLVFFLNMRHTHQVLAQVKAEEQDGAAADIQPALPVHAEGRRRAGQSRGCRRIDGVAGHGAAVEGRRAPGMRHRNAARSPSRCCTPIALAASCHHCAFATLSNQQRIFAHDPQS